MLAKNQLINLLDFMGDDEALELLNYAKDNFRLKAKMWDDIEEDDPTPDEIAAIMKARTEIAQGEFVRHEDIDWD